MFFLRATYKDGTITHQSPLPSLSRTTSQATMFMEKFRNKLAKVEVVSPTDEVVFTVFNNERADRG